MDASNKVSVFDVNGDIYAGWHMITSPIKLLGLYCIWSRDQPVLTFLYNGSKRMTGESQSRVDIEYTLLLYLYNKFSLYVKCSSC